MIIQFFRDLFDNALPLDTYVAKLSIFFWKPLNRALKH